MKNLTLLSTACLNLLAHSTAEELYAKLCSDAFTEAQGCAAVDWLAVHRPAIHNRVLCYFYDVACYHVGTSCFADQSPAEDQDKWFISTPQYPRFSTDEMPIDGLPLSRSQEEAEALAVVTYKLAQAFHGLFNCEMSTS
jgi:hypothetical protein